MRARPKPIVNDPARIKPGPTKLSSAPVFGTEKVAVAIGVVGVTVGVWLGSGVDVGVSVGVTTVAVGVNVGVLVGVLVGVPMVAVEIGRAHV